ncbi:TIGR03111 family XrtG-associated glycosyltransferase [Candidatus Amarobacter glycogenicus]|uniref:TIGR03111 family XrtG-associated glycosyltransferase n=1 Tax=Candidatus Amarobacter glycogenicus TaxID=3140699 RepID=UPI002A0D1986|nr:putative glycosyltransferase, exosortase G system-associated [Dehalococcoidia bacterium]
MATEHWYSALGFWGVWLFVPILVDGFQSFRYLVATIAGRAKRLPIRPVTKAPQGKWPRVSILIPVYNSEAILGACIDSIRAQSYPLELIEILAIDNGSRDSSFKVFCEEQQEAFPGSIHWLSTFHQGKPWALNVGIHYAQGEYVINLDSDVVLHEDAIVNMVAAFENDQDLIAATGAVEIRPESGSSGFMKVIHECEFQEYYFGFNVGRRFESRARSLFTLAGAFSAFRRDVLLNTYLYDTSTVGEDTFMTFELQELFPDKHVSVVTASVCYTDPIPSLRALYAQRVRWQRGEIEVIAAHPKLATRGLFYRGFAPVRTLLVDHTLAFPRVSWTFLMPALVFFGYEVSTVLLAGVALYAAYVFIEAATWTTSALLVVPPSSRRLWHGWWTIPLMPAYRYGVFWLRFAGVLTVLTEAHQWRTADPVAASRDEFLRLVHSRKEPGEAKAA